MADWTPTSERLPAYETPVLIVHRDRVRIGERRQDIPGFEDTYRAYDYWDDPQDDGQDWEWNDVTHWMPMPSLPAAGVTAGLLAKRETRPADPSESEVKIARREGYDEGWNDCLSALGMKEGGNG